MAYQLELGPFDRDQTTELVQRRIATATDQPHSNYNKIDISPFSDRVLDVIQEQSQGSPAVITSALTELVSLAAYQHANDLGSEVSVDLAENIDYAEPEVE